MSPTKLTPLQRSELNEARMHLETTLDGSLSSDETKERVWAALYLIQHVVDGTKSRGYYELLSQLRALDAIRLAMS